MARGSVLRFEMGHQSIFYTTACFGIYQIATFFGELRLFGRALARLV
jgi:hypothetical protein